MDRSQARRRERLIDHSLVHRDRSQVIHNTFFFLLIDQQIRERATTPMVKRLDVDPTAAPAVLAPPHVAGDEHTGDAEHGADL